MQLINDLEYRYATKKFDSQKKVSQEDIEKLKKAIQLSASSYGLQLYKVLIIEDDETKEKIKPAAWNQPQITDASHVFIFCNKKQVAKEDIQSFLELKAETQGLNIDDIKGYGDFILGKWEDKSESEQSNWNAKQTYIALSNLMNAAAELKIDTCPMEGFERDQLDQVLNLDQEGLTAAVIATVGYRSEEDATQKLPKVRRTFDDLFTTI